MHACLPLSCAAAADWVVQDAFRQCGEVVYANVIKDDAGRSKGWGIVEYATPEEVRGDGAEGAGGEGLAAGCRQ